MLNNQKLVFNYFVFGFLISLIFFIVSFFYLLFEAKTLTGTDFVSFITGAKMLREGYSKRLYDKDLQFKYQQKISFPETREWLLPFRNPPVVPLIFIPFTFFSLRTSFILLFAINTKILFVFSNRVFKFFPLLSKFKVVYLISFLYLPSVSILVLGQFSALLVLVFLFIYYFCKKGLYFKAGVLSSLLILKPQFLVFLPFLFVLISRKRELIKGFLLGFGPLLFINILISGRSLFFDYPKFLIETETVFLKVDHF